MLFSKDNIIEHQDLHYMLPFYIQKKCIKYLKVGAKRRQKAIKEKNWDSYKNEIRERVKKYLGDMPFGKSGESLKVKLISRYEKQHHIVENVLFDSLPGWQVNASVYLPKDFPPPWPAIVIPVGHSGKQFESYQIPAQVFAQCGYVAITFDPPGQAGEKQPGNDHFINGIQCYLTGYSSQRYFVIDALRCIDYLETRSDVDTSLGVGMTGVSGGGMTTMWAALFDERIACMGPSCCLSSKIEHPVGDLYPGCPENLPQESIKDGIDETDILCAALPTPMMIMAGKKDEVFKIEWVHKVCEEVGTAYESAGFKERFKLFEDEGGHGYTPIQAIEFSKFMNCWLLKEPNRNIPQITKDSLKMASDKELKCYPSPEENMFTINRRIARKLRKTRPKSLTREKMREKVNMIVKVDKDISLPRVKCAKPFNAWFTTFEEILLSPEEEIQLPAVFLYPIKSKKKNPAILYLNEGNRWEKLRAGGIVAHLAKFLEKDVKQPVALLSAELRGWGDSTVNPCPYESASWSGKGRILSYLSNALGDSLFAMRVRDALSFLSYLRGRPEVDPEKIVVIGEGQAGLIALHLAILNDKIRGVAAKEILSSFQELTENSSYLWEPDIFVANILKYYDLPELIASLCPLSILLINPLDALKRPLSAMAANDLYSLAAKDPNFLLYTGLSKQDSSRKLMEWSNKIFQNE